MEPYSRSPNNIAWLAGLLEGEGSFILHRRLYPRIDLRMTDCDVVERAAGLLGTKLRQYGNSSRNPKHKRVWNTQVDGRYAAGWMMTLYTFMGARRRERIKQILKVWKSHTPKPGPKPKNGGGHGRVLQAV